jgi:hypothetical protein
LIHELEKSEELEDTLRKTEEETKREAHYKEEALNEIESAKRLEVEKDRIKNQKLRRAEKKKRDGMCDVAFF